MRAAPVRRPVTLGAGAPVIFVLLILALAGAMAIQPTRQLFEQRQRIADMTEGLRDTEAANRRLEADIERLNDPDYLEQQAREQFGLVRPGETTFVVMPPRQRHRRRHEEPERTPARAPGFLEQLFEFIGLP
jgi:cell division protein FtsB